MVTPWISLTLRRALDDANHGPLSFWDSFVKHVRVAYAVDNFITETETYIVHFTKPPNKLYVHW